ncbi:MULTISPECIES: dTDP-4-dehydrorhamnose 3,5-epimerase family protein [unclassified Streptomyces]|uniref:dTDP-4-dehydrorhamnose 3,5-epimerase family protein n=1 Tax=unclassified Streptomyces TaxID=2593676 RepID=UPI00324A36CC
MRIEETAVPDAYRIMPRLLPDARGSFHESFRYDLLAAETGHSFLPRQVNYSASARNTVRGLHGVAIPPGQAKLVSCVRGVLLDVVVDVRIGSPTFGRHDCTVLDARGGRAVFVAEGLAHGFVALTDDTCISYLCSTEYVPGTQLDLRAFDPELELPWARWLTGEPLLSEKDANAPTVAEAAERGLLPTYEQCRELYGKRARAAA